MCPRADCVAAVLSAVPSGLRIASTLTGRNPTRREGESVAVDVAGGIGAAPDKVTTAGALKRTYLGSVCERNGSAVYLTSFIGCDPRCVCDAWADLLPRWFHSDVVECYFSADILASEKVGAPLELRNAITSLRNLNGACFSIVRGCSAVDS